VEMEMVFRVVLYCSDDLAAFMFYIVFDKVKPPKLGIVVQHI
jgi:hypothetical protein